MAKPRNFSTALGRHNAYLAKETIRRGVDFAPRWQQREMAASAGESAQVVASESRDDTINSTPVTVTDNSIPREWALVLYEAPCVALIVIEESPTPAAPAPADTPTCVNVLPAGTIPILCPEPLTPFLRKLITHRPKAEKAAARVAFEAYGEELKLTAPQMPIPIRKAAVR